MARAGDWFFFYTPPEPGHLCELGERHRFETVMRNLRAVQALGDLQDKMPEASRGHRERARAEIRKCVVAACDELTERLAGLEPNLDRLLSPH